YLSLNMNLIVTGSKFIGGSPFCGALLTCREDQRTFLNTSKKLPKEFEEYFDESNLAGLVQTENFKIWYNWGLYMRWEVALHEMKRFDRVPEEFQERLIIEWRRKLTEHLENDPRIKIVDAGSKIHLPADASSLSD